VLRRFPLQRLKLSTSSRFDSRSQTLIRSSGCFSAFPQSGRALPHSKTWR
jgi:hypothetical protein